MNPDNDPKRQRPYSRWYCVSCGHIFPYLRRYINATSIGIIPLCPKCKSEEIFAYCAKEVRDLEAQGIKFIQQRIHSEHKSG